jgi:hypothetical protein
MVGFFFVWRLDVPVVLSAYAALSRPTPACADLPTDGQCEGADPGCSAGVKKAALRAAFVIYQTH